MADGLGKKPTSRRNAHILDLSFFSGSSNQLTLTQNCTVRPHNQTEDPSISCLSLVCARGEAEPLESGASAGGGLGASWHRPRLEPEVLPSYPEPARQLETMPSFSP